MSLEHEQEKVSSDSEEIECDEVIVDQLCAGPLLAAVLMDAIIRKSKCRLRTYDRE